MDRRKCLKALGLATATAALGVAGVGPATPAQASPAGRFEAEARQLLHAMSAQPGSKDIAVITNAGWGELDGNPSADLLDALSTATGCTRGGMNLLNPQTPVWEAPWVAIFDKSTMRMGCLRIEIDRIHSEVQDIGQGRAYSPEGWTAIIQGLPGDRAFSMISFAHVWMHAPSWRLLRAGELHNHICPGLNSGYLMAEYALKHFPADPGQAYTIFGAPPNCGNDAFQTTFDATAGKKGTFSAMVDTKELQARYGTSVAKSQIVMRRDTKTSAFDGAILEMDFNAVMADIGVTSNQLRPAAGAKDPLFHISRIKLASGLAAMSLEKKLGYIRELAAISGDKRTYSAVLNAQADPFGPLLRKG